MIVIIILCLVVSVFAQDNSDTVDAIDDDSDVVLDDKDSQTENVIDDEVAEIGEGNGSNVTEDEQTQTSVESTNQATETGDEGGELSLLQSDEGLTPLERYYRTTSVHALRRADVLFFISIPFTLLWSNFLIDRFKDISVIAAYFEGVRGGLNLRNTNFLYNHDSFPDTVGDPFHIFKWLNAVIWPLVIVANDFIERASDPKEWEKAKEEMRGNRFHLNLIYHSFH